MSGDIFYIDIMAKTEVKEVQKGAYRCVKCQNEFVGAECTECGNKENNTRLSSDGLDRDLHTTGHLFKGLKSTENADMDLLRAKAAAAQLEEFDENMRDAYVSRSQIKKTDAELSKLKKESELREARAAFDAGKPVTPGAAPSSQNANPYDSGMGNFSMFGGGMSPQALFMSKLMKMGGEERKTFLSELAEADPQALANLSTMLAQPAPMNISQGGSASMYGMPPWMQQQMMWNQMMTGGHPPQQQPQQPQADPTEVALGMLTSMFEIMQKMNPSRSDDGLKEALKDIKEEIKASRPKEPAPAQPSELRALLDEIQSLKIQVASTNQKKGLAETVTEIKNLVEGLEAVGLVKKPGSEGRTVDDELKVKQFEFSQKTKEKELEIQEKKVDAEKARTEMGKGILGAMFQRSIMKNKEGADVPASSVKKIPVINSRPVVQGVVKPATPPEIIESYKSDAGMVMETRQPVKKEV